MKNRDRRIKKQELMIEECKKLDVNSEKQSARKNTKKETDTHPNTGWFLLIGFLVILIIICLVCFNDKETDTTESSSATTDYTEDERTSWIYEEETYSGETIASEIRELAMLVTAERTYTHVETYTSTKMMFKNLKIPFTQTICVFSIDGRITAGVDLSNADIEIDNKNRCIIVTLENPQVFSNELDNDSFKVFNEKKNIFNPIDFEDANDSFADVKQDEQQKAIDEGFLDTAKSSAETIISSMIESLLPSTYNIKYVYED